MHNWSNIQSLAAVLTEVKKKIAILSPTIFFFFQTARYVKVYFGLIRVAESEYALRFAELALVFKILGSSNLERLVFSSMFSNILLLLYFIIYFVYSKLLLCSSKFDIYIDFSKNKL